MMAGPKGPHEIAPTVRSGFAVLETVKVRRTDMSPEHIGPSGLAGFTVAFTQLDYGSATPMRGKSLTFRRMAFDICGLRPEKL